MASEDRELTFSSVDIYYNYVFDLGGALNPIDAARLLLKTDIAQAFRNYLTGKSEIADVYKSLTENYQELSDFYEQSKLAGDKIEPDEEKDWHEFKQFVAEVVIDLLKLLAVHEYVDRQIFHASYILSFARVGLIPFSATINGHDLDFDVTLTIHRSGVACSAVKKLDRIKPGLREYSALRAQIPQTPPV
jgi:hypothetical protein